MNQTSALSGSQFGFATERVTDGLRGPLYNGVTEENGQSAQLRCLKYERAYAVAAKWKEATNCSHDRSRTKERPESIEVALQQQVRGDQQIPLLKPYNSTAFSVYRVSYRFRRLRIGASKRNNLSRNASISVMTQI